jgi:hypothetical protein
MLKLYKLDGNPKQYWETWEHNGTHTVHWGELGTKGESKEVKAGLFSKPTKLIQKEVYQRGSEGFAPIAVEDHVTLLIEYAVDEMGSSNDLDKRHRLEARMNETLGWTGLGNCDGGSIGSGTMEVCCFVVDFEIARQVIERDLAGTEFGDYSRIFDENA